MTEPLHGVRVVEMSVAIQGPAAGVFLADMGAEVVKIEIPSGELGRYWRGPDFSHPQTVTGSQFTAMNRGKRSVCLDIHTPLGLAVAHRLVESADVFLSNYRAPALERIGMGFEQLRALNGDLVYATVNGFGPQGPEADKAMLDGAAQARGGLAAVTGPADGPPMPPGATVADTSGAMQLALGVMTALYARERHGVAQRVQVSALGAQLWLQAWEIAHSSMTGAPLRRAGSHVPTILAPYGVYETADGGAFFLATVATDEAWDAFWLFVGRPEIVLDERWDTPGKRLGAVGDGDGVPEIRAAVREAFRSRTTAEWDDFLAGQPDVIYERVRGYAEVLEDPQSLANGYLAEIDLPGLGPRRLVGNLVHLSETPGSTKGAPPALGADTASLMVELGFSEEEAAEVEARTAAIRAELGL